MYSTKDPFYDHSKHYIPETLPPRYSYDYYGTAYSGYNAVDHGYSAQAARSRTLTFPHAPVREVEYVGTREAGETAGVHPLLEPGPRYGITSAAILFDIRKSPSHAGLLIGSTSKTALGETDRGASATNSRTSHLRLVFELPWSSRDIRKPDGVAVTVEDVLDAIYDHLHDPFTESEVFLSRIDTETRRRVRNTLQRRCNSQGLFVGAEPTRRVDWVDRPWFGGLLKDFESIRNILGTKKSKEVKDKYVVIFKSSPTSVV